MQKITKKIFFSLFLFVSLFVGFASQAVEPEKLIKVELNFNEGLVKIVDVGLFEGYASKSNTKGFYKYSLKMFSSDGSLLAQEDFSVGAFVSINCEDGENCDDMENEGNVSNLDFNAIIPFDSGAAAIYLFDVNGRFVESMDISEVVGTCTDSECGNDGIVKEEKVEKDVGVVADEEKGLVGDGKTIKYLSIGVLVAVFIALIWVIYWFVNKNKHPEDNIPKDPSNIDNW